MPTPAVELINCWKSFGDVEAVRGVNLCIERGEVVAILGPNGAGKTTCISLMLGLRRPTAGTARLFGLTPEDRRARSRCGVMLQESGVFAQLRVDELVDLFARVAQPGDGVALGTVLLSQIDTAIGVAAGVTDFTLTVPSANIVPALGQLPTLGAITFT